QNPLPQKWSHRAFGGAPGDCRTFGTHVLRGRKTAEEVGGGFCSTFSPENESRPTPDPLSLCGIIGQGRRIAEVLAMNRRVIRARVVSTHLSIVIILVSGCHRPDAAQDDSHELPRQKKPHQDAAGVDVADPAKNSEQDQRKPIPSFSACSWEGYGVSAWLSE